MAAPFISEIRIFSFGYAPKGWAQCNGQLLPMNQNQALYALLGTTYGGNGTTNFALPDFRGRAAMHAGDNHTLGERGGEQAHTLTVSELPTHSHVVNATNSPASNPSPANNLLAQESQNAYSAGGTANTAMSPAMIGQTGGSQAHMNMQPFRGLNFCIALMGYLPSQN
jgi:microcystin-dependent protein